MPVTGESREQTQNTGLRPSAGAALALMLRRLRREQGLSMRDMAGPLNLAAHSAVADYESGRRLPAPDILAAYERHFRLRPGSLLALRNKALAERAGREAQVSLTRWADSWRPPGPAWNGLRPAQLPHDISGFVGRQAQLSRLHELAAAPDGALGTPAIVICSIDGIAGVGKTALAGHFAHQIADRYPDGQLHLDLHGYDPQVAALTPAQALAHLLRGLGADPARFPADVADLAALYRSVLTGRRVLIMLDNAADTGQIRPLLPGSGGCLVLITSRRHLPGLVARDGACRLVLEQLSPAEAMELLVRLLGPAQVAREQQAAAEITRLCGYLPLAIRIAAERLAATELATPQAVPDGCEQLGRLARQLADARSALASLSVEDDETTGVRAAFSWSYRALPQSQARLFRLLAVHPGTSFTPSAVAALAALEQEEAGSLLDMLAAGHLIEQIGADRYRIHDLLRLYGNECFAAEEPPEQARIVAERCAAWYLHTAAAAAKAVRPARRHASLAPRPAGIVPLAFDGYEDALAWLGAEWQNCVLAGAAAGRYGLDRWACTVPGVLYDVFDLRGLLEDWRQSAQTALAAARRLNDAATEASMLHHLAIVDGRTGHYDDALTLLGQARERYRDVGDRSGEASTLGNIGNIFNELGRPDEALPYILDIVAIHRETSDRLGEALSLGNLGLIHERQGRYAEMLAVSARALALFRALRDRPGEARALSNLAAAHVHLQHTRPAISYARRALKAAQMCGARDIEALALRDLGRAYRDQNEPDRAMACWRESVAILEEQGDVASTEVRVLLGTGGTR